MVTPRETEIWQRVWEEGMEPQRKLVGTEGFLEEGTSKLRTETLIRCQQQRVSVG